MCSVGNAWGDTYTLGASTFASSGDNKQKVATISELEFTLDPAHGGTGQTGYSEYIKFSKNKTYTLSLPATLTITNINIKGYTNSNGATNGEITSVAGVSQTGKTFPAKDNSALASQSQITEGYDFAVSQTGGTIAFVTANTNQICVLITITGTAVDNTAPTFTMTTPSTTSNVAITNRSVVLTASEAITKVGDNVAGTLKIGSAEATAINYVYDGSANTLTYTFGEDLAYSKTYAFTVDANQVQDASENQNEATSAFSFTTEADVLAAISSVSPDGGSVNGGSTVTVTAEGTVKYLWSANNTADKSDAGWEEGVSISVPNVGGTRYLHLYAYKRADNQTDIVSKTFNITKIGSATIKSWDFTQELSDDDVTRFNGETSFSLGKSGDYISLGLDISNGLLYKGTKDNCVVVYSTGDAATSFLLISTGSPSIRIPSLQKGDILTINTCRNGDSERSLTVSNGTLTSGSLNAVKDSPTDAILSVKADGDVDLGISGGGMRIYNIKVSRSVPIVEATLSSYEWGTFVSEYALDFSDSEVDAYIITGHSGTAVTKSRVTTVVANTPLLLNATADTYNIPIAASGTDYSASNLLVAGDGSSISAEAGKTKYVLGVSSSDEAEFQKIVSTPATVEEGKAYLQFNEEISLAPSVLRIVDEESNATAVQDVVAGEEIVKFIENGQLLIMKNGVVYDVMGRAIR